MRGPEFFVSVLLLITATLFSCSGAKRPGTAGVPTPRPAGVPILPREIGATGWIREPEIARFAGDSLFEYIDGAAEMYHKYGFREVRAGRYHLDGNTITVDIYEFAGPDRAFGMYATLRPDEPDTVMLGAEGFTFGPNLVFVKGAYLANVYSYGDPDEMTPPVRLVASAIEDRLAGSSKIPETFRLFPDEGRLPFTEKIYAEAFLGHAFLTDVYTVRYSRQEDEFTLFVAADPGSRKLEQWRESVETYYDAEKGLQHLSFDGSRYLLTDDAYYGSILAGPRGEKLVGMVGYHPDRASVVHAWLHALLEYEDRGSY